MRAQRGSGRDSSLYIGGVCGVKCVIGTVIFHAGSVFRCWVPFERICV